MISGFTVNSIAGTAGDYVMICVALFIMFPKPPTRVMDGV